MYDLATFRERIMAFYRNAPHPQAARRLTQADLASEVGLHSTELSKRLNDSGKVALIPDNVRALVRALAKWGVLRTQAEAIAMLRPADCPPFSPAEWQQPPLSPLTPLDATATAQLAASNLPLPLTSFIGREADRATAIALLTDTRLLTITGPGGTDSTTFSPHGTSTRGQFAKVVVLGFGLTLYTPSGAQDFTDVPSSVYAYAFIETGFHNGVLSGYDAGTCASAGATFPCYLPNQPITRGQLTKLAVNAAHYPLFTPTGGTPTFSDVPASNVFFVSIETAHNKCIINGYPGGIFLPNQAIQRDQMCQIVYKGVTTP